MSTTRRINNFTYFYAVTAFDVNSQASGPHTLRSARVAQSVVPRATNSALGTRFNASVVLSGDDGVELDLDPIRSGSGCGYRYSSGSAAADECARPAGRSAAVGSGRPVDQWPAVRPDRQRHCGGRELRLRRDGRQRAGWVPDRAHDVRQRHRRGIDHLRGRAADLELRSVGWSRLRVRWAPARIRTTTRVSPSSAFLPGAGEGVAAGLSGTWDQTLNDPSFVGQRVRRFPTSGYQAGGNRWFDGTVEVTPDPTTVHPGRPHRGRRQRMGADSPHGEFIRRPRTTYPASGQMQCFGYTLSILSRAADYQFTWNGDGTVTVRDITHNVPVDFKPTPQMSYGFLNTDGNGNGVIDWQDFDYLDVIRQESQAGGTNGFCALASAATHAAGFFARSHGADPAGKPRRGQPTRGRCNAGPGEWIRPLHQRRAVHLPHGQSPRCGDRVDVPHLQRTHSGDQQPADGRSERLSASGGHRLEPTARDPGLAADAHRQRSGPVPGRVRTTSRRCTRCRIRT